MENINIMWVHRKIHFLEGDCHKKTIYWGLKRGLGQFEDIRDRAWQKRGQCTLCRLLALTRLSFPALHL